MGALSFLTFMPHPPIILPEVGGRELAQCRETVSAMEQAAKDLVGTNPETIVLITPHGAVFQDAIAITAVASLKGNMAQFGAPQVTFSFANDLNLVNKLNRTCKEKKVSTVLLDENIAQRYGVDLALDHGAMVPLYYLSKAGFQGSLVLVAMGMLPPLELYSFGIALQEAVETLAGDTAVIASGDLSHRLTRDAPNGYNPKGKEFDEKVQQALAAGRVESIVGLPRSLAEEAGECGLRPLIMMLGGVDGRRFDVAVLSYQGPFGVGYMVAELIPDSQARESLLSKLKAAQQQKINNARANEHPVVRLARETLEAYIRHGHVIEPDFVLPAELPRRAGVFVSLKKHGQLRGCIGTIEPTKKSLAEEIMGNALSAGLRDHRFNQVEEEELSEITYSVDILYPAESIDGISELDPRLYGVIVSAGGRSGLLLPNLDGIDNAEDQVHIALQKAGISPGEKYAMKRFRVDRYY